MKAMTNRKIIKCSQGDRVRERGEIERGWRENVETIQRRKIEKT